MFFRGLRGPRSFSARNEQVGVRELFLVESNPTLSQDTPGNLTTNNRHETRQVWLLICHSDATSFPQRVSWMPFR